MQVTAVFIYLFIVRTGLIWSSFEGQTFATCHFADYDFADFADATRRSKKSKNTVEAKKPKITRLTPPNMSSSAAAAAFAAPSGRVAAITGANKGVGFFIGE